MNRSKLIAFTLLLISAAGCNRFLPKTKAQPRLFVPPPVTVRTTPLPQLMVAEPPPNPGMFLDIASIPFPIFMQEIELPERPPAPPPRTRPQPVQPLPVEPVEPTPPPVPVPKLTRILSDDDVRAYTAEVDDSTRTAEQVLQAASKQRLAPAQVEMSRQVRSFVDQARAQRETDLVAARNLARRAIILARDLQRTLK